MGSVVLWLVLWLLWLYRGLGWKGDQSNPSICWFYTRVQNPSNSSVLGSWRILIRHLILSRWSWSWWRKRQRGWVLGCSELRCRMSLSGCLGSSLASASDAASANSPRKLHMMTQVLRAFHPCGRYKRSSWLLASCWPSSGCCSHLGNKSVDTICLFLSLPLNKSIF